VPSPRSEERDVEPAIDAGPFSTWLADVVGAIRGERTMDVPCNGCTACCTASQFVPIGPDETDTLARIPAALLFPAPREPEGHVVLGYDERGHCPMLVEGHCTIYAHRPRACRTYDCRVLAAAGLDASRDDATKAGIARRVGQWRFDYPTPADRRLHDAVRATAATLEEQVGAGPPGSHPPTATQVAIRAIELNTSS
jgi:hypothetical protein